MNRALHEALEADTATLGLSLTAHEADHLIAFTELLARWNVAIRLAGPSDPRTLLREQVLEALVYRPFIRRSASWWDIGSGGGLPALALAGLEPDVRFHLVEPIGKKVTFLKQAALQLGLGGRVLVSVGRLGDDGGLPPEARRDPAWPRAAMSRATFPPESWYPRAARLVGPGGLVLVASAARLEDAFAREARVDARLAEAALVLPATSAPRHLSLVTVPAPA